MVKEPVVNEKGAAELKKAEDQFQELQRDFKEEVHVALERRISLPECEPENDIRAGIKQQDRSDARVIRPLKSISDKAKFNEKYRKQWEEGWTYVKAIIQNHEIIGESVECWT